MSSTLYEKTTDGRFWMQPQSGTASANFWVRQASGTADAPPNCRKPQTTRRDLPPVDMDWNEYNRWIKDGR